MESKTVYVTVRIDFQHDGRFDEEDIDGIVADQVIADALSHIHTIENGVQVTNITNYGEE